MIRRLCGAVALGLLVAAAPAAASTKTATTPLSSLSVGAPTASCPKKQFVEDIGFRTLYNSSSFGYIYGLSGRKKSATAQALGAQGSGPTFVSAIAYCSKENLKTKTRTATAVVPPSGNYGTATATCPKHTQIAYGGFLANMTPGVGGHDVEINGLYRTGSRSWTARATNFNSFADTLTSIVYCSKKIDKAKEVRATAALVPNSPGTAVAVCSGKKSISYGGFIAPSDNDVPYTVINAIERRGDGFAATAYNDTIASSFVTSIAYCT